MISAVITLSLLSDSRDTVWRADSTSVPIFVQRGIDGGRPDVICAGRLEQSTLSTNRLIEQVPLGRCEAVAKRRVRPRFTS
jgi:hypothetical protein